MTWIVADLQILTPAAALAVPDAALLTGSANLPC
jgi:hypothetical protein